MFLIVGLGNPGKEYEITRHNAGFLAVDFLRYKYNLTDEKKKYNFLYTKSTLFNQDVVMMKPQSYMNNSGSAIASALSFFKIPQENLIVIYDDTALPVGMLRIRENGSNGGHNGLRDIEQHLKSKDYKRIRIGIDKPEFSSHMKDYVLGRFTNEDIKTLESDVFPVVDSVVNLIVNNKIKDAMNIYNKKVRKTGKDDTPEQENDNESAQKTLT